MTIAPRTRATTCVACLHAFIKGAKVGMPSESALCARRILQESFGTARKVVIHLAGNSMYVEWTDILIKFST
jgi:hypothetical protein